MDQVASPQFILVGADLVVLVVADIAFISVVAYN